VIVLDPGQAGVSGGLIVEQVLGREAARTQADRVAAPGRVGAAAMESIGRNPNAADKLFLPLVLTLALLEALALYGFVIAILLQGKI